MTTVMDSESECSQKIENSRKALFSLKNSLVGFGFFTVVLLLIGGSFRSLSSSISPATRNSTDIPVSHEMPSIIKNLMVFPDDKRVFLFDPLEVEIYIYCDTIIDYTSRIEGLQLSKDSKFAYFIDENTRQLKRFNVESKTLSDNLNVPNFPIEMPIYPFTAYYVVDKNDSNRIFYGFIDIEGEVSKRMIARFDFALKTSEYYETKCRFGQDLHVTFQSNDGSKLFYSCSSDLPYMPVNIYQKSLIPNPADDLQVFTTTDSTDYFIISPDCKFALIFKNGFETFKLFDISMNVAKDLKLEFKFSNQFIRNVEFSKDGKFVYVVKWEPLLSSNCVKIIDFEKLKNNYVDFIMLPLIINVRS